MVSSNIPDLAGKEHIRVVALDKIVSDPSQVAHCILRLSSSSIRLQAKSYLRSRPQAQHALNANDVLKHAMDKDRIQNNPQNGFPDFEQLMLSIVQPIHDAQYVDCVRDTWNGFMT